MGKGSYERIVFIFLSITLLVGAARLYLKQSRPFAKIIIIKNGVKEKFTLKQIEQELLQKRKININSSSIEEISSIPGIGKVLASRIVGYREEHGAFASKEALTRVRGMGKKKLESTEKFIEIL